MKTDDPQPTPNNAPERRSRWPWFLAIGCLLVLLLPLLQTLRRDNQPARTDSSQMAGDVSPKTERTHSVRHASDIALSPTAEEIVAGKLAQFGKSRRKLVHDLAEHFKTTVPAEVERFFDALEAGRYDEMQTIYKALQKQRENGTDRAWYGPVWRSIQEAWGAAEQAHTWPAQKLLDYGNAVLDSLRPGMVYVGGTDPGCFIPTFLNETSDGEHHITLTQNALADGTYLDYLNFLYGDKMKTLTGNDSQRAFQDYFADAKKRFDHDQQFPDEPKQLRPGENITMAEGRVQVSGQVAVMMINEKLIQTLMQNNPNLSFAMEQSFALTSTYANATPLGPIMELGVKDEQNALNSQRATQSVDYWRTTAQQLLADPESAASTTAREAYAKMASEQAALLLDRKFTAEAEQAFQIALQLQPSSPETVSRYANMLTGQKRSPEAIAIVEDALKASPTNKTFADLLKQLKKVN